LAIHRYNKHWQFAVFSKVFSKKRTTKSVDKQATNHQSVIIDKYFRDKFSENICVLKSYPPFLHSQITGSTDNDGDVAQSVEQRTENPCVGGSIPSITTTTATNPLILNELRGLFFEWGQS
jgi:hypothetical protein